MRKEANCRGKRGQNTHGKMRKEANCHENKGQYTHGNSRNEEICHDTVFSVDKKSRVTYNNRARAKREFLCAQKDMAVQHYKMKANCRLSKNMTKGE